MSLTGSSPERAKWLRESGWGVFHHYLVPDERVDGHARHGTGKGAAITRDTAASKTGRILDTAMRQLRGLKDLRPNPVPGA